MTPLRLVRASDEVAPEIGEKRPRSITQHQTKFGTAKVVDWQNDGILDGTLHAHRASGRTVAEVVAALERKLAAAGETE